MKTDQAIYSKNNAWRQEVDWEEKAKTNPLYAIMSEEVFSESSATPTPAELNILFAKGQRIWESWMQPAVHAFSIDLSQSTVAEFGCGMGRILRVPASLGATTYGFDISGTQLSLAQTYFGAADKAHWIKHTNQVALPLKSGSVDFLYSYAVLQHIPSTRDLKFAIREMCRLLRKGGILKIQLPVFGSPFNNYTHQGRQPFLCKNFNKHVLVGYWKHFSSVKIPVVRVLRNNYWGRIGLSPIEIIRLLAQNGVDIKVYEYNISPNLTWITAQKK
jgi:SAM-dependent methyltransferase